MNPTTDIRTDLDRRKFFIDGRWAEPLGSDTHVALEASTGEPLGTAALGTDADVDAAVRAARRALDEGPWGTITASGRATVMRRFAAALAARGEATATLVSRENGMPIAHSTAYNGVVPAAIMQMYADLIETIPLESVRQSPAGSTVVRQVPVGVVGAITAWNYPQALAMMKIAPALAAGCTVVLKPSPETALDGYVLAEAAEEAGLPPGVLNIVVADREAGAALVSHPLVDKIAFTGSTAAGRLIGAECARLVRRCTLELGGKSAAVVLDDVDIDTFVAGIGAAAFLNNGQTCTVQSRILAPRSRYGEIVDAVADVAAGMVIGDPLDPGVDCGPMVSEAQLERVLGYIELGRAGDSRLVAGGGTPTGLDRGWFVEPTVFADVDNTKRIAQEEIFGPVVTITPYDGDDDAIRLANASEYGLGGSVWTADEQHGLAVARRIRTGTIGINYYQQDLGAPFGGMKSSGIGRELGPEALHEYLEYQSIYAGAALLTGE